MNTHMIPCPCPFVKRGYAEISSIFLENRRAKVLFSMVRGKAEEENGRENEYFTAAVIGGIFLAAAQKFPLIYRAICLAFAAGVCFSLRKNDCRQR